MRWLEWAPQRRPRSARRSNPGTPERFIALAVPVARRNRWVWVIEDAHWADGATLDLLRFLSRRIDSLPLLLIVTFRDDELDGEHPLSIALGDLATCASVTRIRTRAAEP